MGTRYFVYVLRCGDGTLYTGIALDVAARIQVHESGRGAKYTRGRGPFELLCTWRFGNKADALRHELAVKALSRKAKDDFIARVNRDRDARRVRTKRAQRSKAGPSTRA